MCFMNIKACLHILLHQIHKIMIFKKATYDPFKNILPHNISRVFEIISFCDLMLLLITEWGKTYYKCWKLLCCLIFLWNQWLFNEYSLINRMFKCIHLFEKYFCNIIKVHKINLLFIYKFRNINFLKKKTDPRILNGSAHHFFKKKKIIILFFSSSPFSSHLFPFPLVFFSHHILTGLFGLVRELHFEQVYVHTRSILQSLSLFSLNLFSSCAASSYFMSFIFFLPPFIPSSHLISSLVLKYSLLFTFLLFICSGKGDGLLMGFSGSV